MTTLRTQGIERVSVTAVNGAATTVTLPRPKSAALPPYAEGTDHVADPTLRREYEAGHCVVELGAGLIAANVFLDKVEIVRLPGVEQKGVPSPGQALFPSGAPFDGDPIRVLVDRKGADDLPTNDPSVAQFLGRPGAGTIDRAYPGITIRSEEALRVTLRNASGADITDSITVVYKLGQNQADTGRP